MAHTEYLALPNNQTPHNSEELFGCLATPPRTPPESGALSVVESPNTTTGATRRGVWLPPLPNTPNTPNIAVFGCLETPPQTTYQRLLAAQPQACPSCGSGEIAPLFEGDWWDCQGGHRWEARAFAALHEED